MFVKHQHHLSIQINKTKFFDFRYNFQNHLLQVEEEHKDPKKERAAVLFKQPHSQTVQNRKKHTVPFLPLFQLRFICVVLFLYPLLLF